MSVSLLLDRSVCLCGPVCDRVEILKKESCSETNLSIQATVCTLRTVVGLASRVCAARGWVGCTPNQGTTDASPPVYTIRLRVHMETERPHAPSPERAALMVARIPQLRSSTGGPRRYFCRCPTFRSMSVSTSFGGLPSVQVVCHLEDGRGKKSREAGTLIERNNACPSFDDFTLSIKLPGCAYAPILSICVYSDMGRLVATKDIKIYGSETMLQHSELEATPPVRNCRISAKIRLFRGIASIMFSSELKEQVKRKQMLREMGPHSRGAGAA